MPRTAKPVVTVDETLMLSKGRRPVRISQTPSNVNPRFLPAKLLVSAMRSSFLNRPIELNYLIPLQTLRLIQPYRDWRQADFIATEFVPAARVIVILFNTLLSFFHHHV